MSLFTLKQGTSPLIISVPHAGTQVPEDIRARFTAQAQGLPDTDWHIPQLYNFADDLNATIIAAHYSRYVIDLNRPPDNQALYPGQVKIPLCPVQTFDGRPIFHPGQEPDDEEIAQRLSRYWSPYHQALEAEITRVKALHGYAILYDAHSIKAQVPRLFDGTLPDLNLGTVNGASCADAMAQAALSAAQSSPDFSAVLNGRFIGGYITRRYGDPENNVHALQMELATCNYMDEQTLQFDEQKAQHLRPVLKAVIQAALDWGNDAYNPARTTPAQGLKPKR